jgi:bacillithiol biosynthesis cysteine-adding enzyme BshC
VATGIADAYLGGGAREFFDAHPSDVAHRRALVEKLSRPLTPAVADELERQNSSYAASAARDRNLALLRSGAAAVVTGQQMGLFLGPLYTLYKAASAIRDAEALTAETGRPVVPIFWLQTEDHDVPEIATCELPGAALSVSCGNDNRVSVAHLGLPGDVDARLSELVARVGGLPHAADHLARLQRCYRSGAGWVSSFATVLAELFAAEGLVLIDPRTEPIANAASAVHRRALIDANPIAALLIERATKLSDAGFSPMVHVREHAPLSFFHPVGVDGPRFRLEPTAGGFAEVGGTRTHSRESLLAALERSALSFSSSALLRPLVQDTVLPTVAYVGGPGELAYFAQLSPLYAFFGRPMPLIVPRARFRLIEPRVAATLKELSLTPDTVDSAEVLHSSAAVPRDPEFDARFAAFETALSELAAVAEKAGLSTPARKTRATAGRAAGKLREKYDAARKLRDDPSLQKVRELRAALSPHGAPQERVFGLSWFASLVGERALVERVLASVVPFDGKLRDIYL